MRLAWLVLAIGCGREGFDERFFDAGRDATTDAALCDPATPFGAPVPLPGVNSTDYDSTFIPLPDELTAYFYSNRGAANYDIYRATRPDLAADWTVETIPELSSTAEEKEPSLSPDGKLLAFTSDRKPDVGGDDLWYATYDGTAFTVQGPITAFETTATDYHPLFQGDELWFSSNICGTFSIYHAPHTGASFGAAAIESELEVAGFDTSAAAPSADGLTMYFRSNRPGTFGDLDVYVARRASVDEPFGAAAQVAEVSSANLDTPNWISPDGCRLYLSSSRDDTSNIYLATKPR